MKLTKQQNKIVCLLTNFGCGNNEIAERLGISVPTAKLHIMNITRKVEKELGVKHLNRTQVALYFLKNNIDNLKEKE